MYCKQELDVIAAMLNDFISTLPPSARAAVSSQCNACLKNIDEALKPAPKKVKLPKPLAPTLPVSDAVTE